MNRYQLYKILKQHLRLSDKRSPLWERNKTGKVLGWVLAGIAILYLMFFAVMFSLIVNDSSRITAYEFMYGILPFILTIDFLFRFAFQQTPSQLVKPYVLLPVSKYACIDCFLANSIQSSYNLIWFAMFIPFAIMSVVFSEGIMVTLCFLLGLYLFMIANSQWYMLIRSLVNTHIAWWIFALAVYALIFSPAFIGKDADIVQLCDFYAVIGKGVSMGNPIYFIWIIALILLLLFVNRKIQYKLVWQELGKDETQTTGNTIRFSFLDRMGEVGEFLKLEVKSIIRNKNIKKTFVSGTVIIIVFSLLLSFTDVYDSVYMKNFWCVYCFALYGAMILVKLMCYEGNYIDGLMVHKEKILTLLTAKYYFYSALLIFPLLLMLPTVFTGKCSLLMLVAFAFFTAGFEYFLFFQMAVYNKQTMPLNTKFIGKGTMENSYLQIGIQMIIFIAPVAVIVILQSLFSDTVTYSIILLFGMAFIALHKVWMKNIYNRMMRRRYENMEGFRASR